MPFLTELDSRAAVKGSRDPLGLQAIWTRLGRRVVGNLTTASDSVRDFTVLVLGFHFIERVRESGADEGDLATFLKWEQLAAYARAAVNRDFGFRGTERVRKNLAEGGKVTLSPSQESQILSDQKTYGLWGLYIMPARASGLLEGSPHRLTPPAEEYIRQSCLPLLSKSGLGDGRGIVSLLKERQSHVNVEGSHAGTLKAVAQLLRGSIRREEREFYRFHLLNGGPDDSTGGLQRQLAGLLERTLDQDDFGFSPAVLTKLVRWAGGSVGKGGDLADRLERIRTSEAVLAPVSYLFGYLLSQHGADLESVGMTLRRQWGGRVATVIPDAFEALRPEIQDAVNSGEAAERWGLIAEALAGGDYLHLLRLLLEQNRFVMTERNGSAPWAELRGGKLHVRFRDETSNLPQRKGLAELWRFPYFMPSLRRVALALRETPR